MTEGLTVTLRKGKVDATLVFLQLCERNGWGEPNAVERTPDMPQDSFRWLCTPSGWRAKQVEVRARFNSDEETEFQLIGRARDAEQIASGLRGVEA
jgi:hypothetical protein